MAQLVSGKYYIKSRATGGYIGRGANEDRSLLPKNIILLPEGIEAPEWELEVCGPTEFTLKTQGAPTAARDEEVVALLIEQNTAEKWKITLDERTGDAFIIELQEGVGGWLLPGTEHQPGTAVACRPLVVGRSMPPFYPDNELWYIVRIVQAD